MPKQNQKAKDIMARSITLKDSKGRTRIFMAADDDPVICLFGPRHRSIQILADHEGGLSIRLDDGSGKIVAGLGIASDDRVGIYVYDHRSGCRTELGSDMKNQPPHITIHHHGRTHWTTRKRKPGKSA
jgi:hypothetical protein